MQHDLKLTSITDTETGEVRHKRIYLAGPMSGIPEFNFPAFNTRAAQLRSRGWHVFNPAENDLEGDPDFQNKNPEGDIEKAEANGFSLRAALKDDLCWICEQADAIYMMKGWERSSGARTEWSLACCLRLEICYE